ncbi:hypothetical protein CK203_088459 [Vitis vinifera]|uniref:Uncharacterized protein n=1 Tax=Vitis vinifera TaxID=29760 RepID=A0A438ELK3_VITVI|nr:hypothetical protein CK203_088459 [Vitis vinifera]
MFDSGLSIIQKYNPDATLLAHKNTMCRIGKGDWSLGYTSVSGNEEICIGGQRLHVIFAPLEGNLKEGSFSWTTAGLMD